MLYGELYLKILGGMFFFQRVFSRVGRVFLGWINGGVTLNPKILSHRGEDLSSNLFPQSNIATTIFFPTRDVPYFFRVPNCQVFVEGV